MKEAILLSVLLLFSTQPLFSDSDCYTQNAGIVIFTITVPQGDSISRVELKFYLSNYTSADPNFTIQEGEATPVSIDDDGNEVVTQGGLLGSEVTLSHPSGSSPYTLTITKKSGTYTGTGSDTFEFEVNSLDIADPYNIVCPSITNNGSGTATYDISPCTEITAIRIQSQTGFGTDTGHDVTTIATTTDTGDEVALYANAYDGAIFIGPINVSWGINGNFDSGDLSVLYGSSLQSASAIEFTPDNGGTNGTLTAVATHPPACTTPGESDSIPNITVAGPLSYIKVVDTATNPDPDDEPGGDAVTSVTMRTGNPSPDTLTLYAAGFDSANLFRNIETANWSLSEVNPVEAYTDSGVDSNLTIATDPPSATFDPECTTGRLKIIANVSGYSDDTGTVSVTAGALDTISIRKSDGSHFTTAERTIAVNDDLILNAFGYDSCQNQIGFQSATWEIISDTFPPGTAGTLSVAAGEPATTVTFIAPNNTGSATVRATSGALQAANISINVTDDESSDENGFDDLVNVYGHEGKATAWVHLSTGSDAEKQFEYRSSVQRFAGFWGSQRWLVGDFNGDGFDDLVNVYSHEGNATAWVHLSTGSGAEKQFEYQSSVQRFAGFWDSQRWLVGDFDGDGFDDLVNVYSHEGNATAWVHLSTGSGFEHQSSIQRFAGFWTSQRWLVGDFNGDGFDDLVNVYSGPESKATAWVHLSTGADSEKQFEYRSSIQRLAGFWDSQRWLVGDFNGDGFDDLVNVYGHEDKATAWVHLSTGAGSEKQFEYRSSIQRFAGFSASQRWLVGDFNGDGFDDLVNVYSGQERKATAWVHLSTGSNDEKQFEYQSSFQRFAGFWASQRWLVGNFNGDGVQ